MDFLGIGPLELIFILLLLFILINPKDIQKTGQSIGRTLRKIVTSDQYRVVNQTSKELRNLPNKLIREAGIEETTKDIPNLKEIGEDLNTTLKTVGSDLHSTLVDAGTGLEQDIEDMKPIETEESDISSWITPSGSK
jgi:Sec-independent protein translocase protein TatA